MFDANLVGVIISMKSLAGLFGLERKDLLGEWKSERDIRSIRAHSQQTGPTVVREVASALSHT